MQGSLDVLKPAALNGHAFVDLGKVRPHFKAQATEMHHPKAVAHAAKCFACAEDRCSIWLLPNPIPVMISHKLEA